MQLEPRTSADVKLPGVGNTDVCVRHRNINTAVRTTEPTQTRGFCRIHAQNPLKHGDSATFTRKGLLRQPRGAISEHGACIARTNASLQKVQARCVRRLIAIYAESSKRGRAAMTATFALQ